MNKQEAIDVIKNLYPADSCYTETSEIGRKLLFDAIAHNWHELPENILVYYARLCQEKDQLMGKR